MTLDLAVLEQLCAAPGLPGNEKLVADVVARRLAELGIENETDRLGNLVAHVRGQGPRVLLLVHLDEVGLLVRKITVDGFLLVERIGGTSVQALPGQRLELWTARGRVPALVGVLPQHLASQAATPALDRIYVDIGASSREEAEALGAEVGSALTWRPVFEILNGSRVSAKALDNRLGCYALLQLAAQLTGRTPCVDLYLGFSVQEESSLSGGLPIVQRVHPDFVIGLDATLAFDTPDLRDGQTEVRLGGGPAVKVMDHIRGALTGLIPHAGLRRHSEATANRRGITFQRELVIGLSTAASPVPFVGEGIPTAAISFPLRYSHSPVETAELTDVQRTIELLEALVTLPFEVA